MDLPFLLINIWEYANKPNDPILIQYQKWCIEIVKQKWQPHYLDFDVIQNLKKQNKKFYNFGNISSADRNVFCGLIYRW